MRKRLIFFQIKSIFWKTTSLFFLIPFWGHPVIAGYETSQDLVPLALLRWPANGSEYAVLVDKSNQKVLVYHREHLLTPEKVFACSTGENAGPKTKQYDKKTPEGIYFFTKSYLEEDLAPIYGVRAYPIDYPNVIDRKEGKYGHGIWFHGLNKPLKPRDTNGCIALDNGDIEELASYIKLYETPIIISSKLKMIHISQLDQRRRALEEIIEGWRKAWEEKAVDQYISFYHKAFSGSGMNRLQWKNYKSGLANRYKVIQVEVRDLQLFSNDGLVMARFKQRFRGDRFESIGDKTLYFKKNSNQWKIFGEFFKEKQRRIIPVKEAIVTSLGDVKEFLKLWKTAWESEDLGVYISCYDKNFESRGMNLYDWKKHKKGLSEKYETIQVKIEDLKIIKKSNHMAMVTFKQDYLADDYHDFGLKRMYLIKEREHWKIKRESWIPLERKTAP